MVATLKLLVMVYGYKDWLRICRVEKNMSQEGFEPSTLALKGRYSTAELLAHKFAETGKV